MKKTLLSLTILTALIAGCAPKPAPAEPSLDLNVVVGTMMAATLTAVAPTPVPPTDTPAPIPTPTELPPGTVIEEFGSDSTFPEPNWLPPYKATLPESQFTVNVIPDYLQFNLPQAETYVYAFTKKEMPADVVIEAAYIIEGKRYSEAAVICRVDPNTKTKWYEFRINHLDKSGVIYYFDRVDVYQNPYKQLAYAKLPVELFSDRDNRIRAVCQGSKLSLELNGVPVTSVENNLLPGGGLVGLGGLAHNQPPLNVNFNYFRVQPAAQ